ncbi:MAG: hypothetical protein EOO75_04410 [Myxococcales bacterium]|nr:MAG: hypothetical protein EOO75_04410 [Myxococcales bacterium]
MLNESLDRLRTGSLLLAAVQAYLVLNKVWSRRHDRRVAGAQSLASNLLGVLVGLPWLAQFVRQGETALALVAALWLALLVFLARVALGAETTGSVGQRARRVLGREWAQLGELARSLVRPAQGDLALDILRQVALIDHHLDPRERQFIDALAARWRLPSPLPRSSAASSDTDTDTAPGAEGYAALRRTVEAYLLAHPPRAQVTQLREVLASLAGTDDRLSSQESLILPEITGQLDAYLAHGSARPSHRVVIVPQSAAQDEALRSLLRITERIVLPGTAAYLVGPFYTGDYARMIRDRYRTLGFAILDETGAPDTPAS